MSDFIVYSVPGSPFGRSVLATLEEKGAAYRLSPLAPGMFRTPEHLARHPFGRVPTLQHGDFSLYETQAILRYLDRVLPTPALTPSDAKAAGLMDQIMNVSDWYLFQGVNSVIGFQRVVGPRLMGLAPDLSAIEAALPKAQVAFDALSRLLADKPFFVGDSLSLADLILAPHIAFLAETPEWSTLGLPRPNLAAWIERMEARPSLAATTWERVAEMAKAA